MTGPFSRLLEEIAATLEPLVAASEDEYVRARLLGCLGYPDPALIDGGLLPAIGAVAETAIFIREMTQKSDPPTLADLGTALDRVRDLAKALRAAGASDGGDTANLAGDLINLIILERLRSQSPLAFQIAYVLGLVEQREVEAIVRGDKIIRVQSTVDRINLAGLEALISDPVAVLGRDLPAKPLATRTDANRTADVLVGRFRGLLTALGLPTVYGWAPGDEVHLGKHAPDLAHTLAILVPRSLGLEAEGMLCVSLSAADEGDLGIVVTPVGQVALATSVESWNVETKLSAQVDSLAFCGGAGFRTLPDLGPGQVQGSVSVSRPPLEDGPAIVLGEAEGTRLELGSPAITASLTLGSGSSDVWITFETGMGALVVKPGSSDGFLASLLPADGLRADFDLGLMWSTNGGLRFKGTAALELRVPVGKSLGPVTLSDCHLAIRAADGALTGEASLTLSGQLGPVKAVIDRIGIAARLFFAEEGGSLGVADLDVGFKPPSGIGLVVEAAGVATGGGFLFYDGAQKLYAGVLEISLSELFTLKAFGLITTQLPDGSPGFTLVVFLTAEDFQPIQLGMGFTLNGIGGMLAINRTFDEDALRNGMKSGILASVLFPRDPVANAPAVINALSVAFPARRDAYLFGVLVKIGWFTPTLVAFNLALILEIGVRRRLLVLGRVSALLPSADNDLVRLNLESVGVIDFDEGTVALDAVLVDSRLVHKFVLTGGMALRARWSDGPGSSFVLAVGGLNPRFAPPAWLPKLDRIAIALSSGDNPRITCAAYFAITANTLQFGAHAELYAASYGFSIEGDIGFDVLIQYRPLHFIADFHASAQLKRGSTSLFQVTVNGSLEGPRPLRASGQASFEICWCDFSVRFDKTLVEGEPPPPPPAIDVLAVLREALADPHGWQAKSETSHGVVLRNLSNGDALIVDPVGRLEVRQQVVPLNTERDVDLFGGAPVSGDRRFALAATLNGARLQATAVREQFAPSQYFDLTDDEKLTGPSFEEMDAGIAVGDTAIKFAEAEIVPAPIEYESVVIDDPDQAPAAEERFTLEANALVLLTSTGAAARAPVRRVGKARFRDAAAPPAVTMHATEWRIVSVDDQAPIAATVEAKSWTEQRATLATLNREGVRWQLVPAYELAA